MGNKQKMIERLGSEEAYREWMRENAAKSKRNKGGKGGFASLSPEKLAEVSAKGGRGGQRGNTDESKT